MFKHIAAIFLFVLLAAYTVHAGDKQKNIAGYGKTIWGMTPNEVLKAEKPRAVKLREPIKYETKFGLITINEIQIGVTRFRAIYLFDKSSEKLNQVNLECVENDSTNNDFAFSAVEQLLIEKYGTPTYKKENDVVSWKLKGTYVKLTYMNLPYADISKVIISYMPSIENQNKSNDL